ncbi:MAG: DNA polymerase ligase N-terminal domain-containing protein [Thermoanaerobaculia bacterium]
MTADDRLKEYQEKRDFRRTAEPRGGSGGGGTSGGRPRFVVQKHDARNLHYDLRLEIGGVLPSWAVPKGPSTDPSEKRLAVRTEDHPLEYVDFEGVIAEGEYGAGTVLVWDTGPFRNLKDDVSLEDALEGGHLTVWLEGEKLRGGYALTRTKMRGDPRNWILVKMDDEGADARRNPTSTEPRSVLTGRTLEEVAAEEGGEAGAEASGGEDA